MLSDATAVPITPRELMSWTQVARSVMAAQMCAHTCMTIIPAQAPLVRLKPSVGGRPMHAQQQGWLWQAAGISSRDYNRSKNVKWFQPCCAGDYKCDGCPDAQPRADDKGFSCKPMSSVTLLPDNSLHTDDPAMRVIVEGGWRNKLTLPQIEKLGIPIVHTWNHSVPLWEYHHGFPVRSQTTPSPGRHAYSVALNTQSLRKRELYIHDFAKEGRQRTVRLWLQLQAL